MNLFTLADRVLHSAKSACLALLVVFLAACGGGGSGGNYFEPEGSGSSGSSSSGGSTGEDPVEDVVSIGAVVDGTFVQGAVAVAVDPLSAGGTTEVSVNLINQNGDPVAEEQTINFSSRCSSDGTAILDTGVPTSGGQAVAEYEANGCVGEDEIRATVDIDGTTLTARGSLTVEPEDIGSLEFVEAEPPQIALAGTGGDETSRVSFRLVGEAGGPIAGAELQFALNATTGGLSLTDDSGVTNSNGVAGTTVRAGSVATSVRVTATEPSTGISTQSSQLVVSTGIPDSDSVSISTSSFNPAAFNYDGEEVEITIRAADQFNNPVPDGTAFSFYTEGGSIDPSCTTADQDGSCTVTWRSQNPRPMNGRVTILATAIGNESFTDVNGSGRFDSGEPFSDIPEAFADENEDGQYNAGEFFIDFGPDETRNGQWDAADGDYNGVLCAEGNGECSSVSSLIVSDQIVIVMSSQFPDGVLVCGGTAYAPGDEVVITGTTPCQLTLGDELGNSLPGGTDVSLQVSDDWELGGTTSYTVANTTGPATTGLSIQSAGPTSGTLTVAVETPKGNLSQLSWPLTL